MHRRRYLATGLAASGLLAGCLTLSDGGTNPTPRPSVAIVDRAGPPDIPAQPSVDVFHPDASDDTPPQLEATVTNTADYPIEVGEERAIVFSYVESEQQSGLTLLPFGGAYPAVEPGCWRLAEPVAIAEYYGIVSLDAGESTQQRIGVWGSPDGEGCLPSGEFRFSTQYAGARDNTDGIDEQAWQGSWGFTLKVT